MAAHARQTSVSRAKIKAAEVASGLGGIVLGAGLALIAPEALRAFATPLLVTGLLVHAGGMTLKHRLEQARRAPLWWEIALFWACWVMLAALGIWLALGIIGA